MILELITPLFYKLFIDEVILNGKFSFMKFIVLGYIALFLIGTVIGYFKKYGEYKFIHTVIYRIKNKIFQGYLQLPFTEYEVAKAGDMKMRLDDDTALIREYASTQTIEYVISFITMLVSIVILFITDWRLALFSMTAIPTTFGLDNLVSKYEKKLNETNRVIREKHASWLQVSVQGWKEIRALNLERAQLRKFVHFVHIQARYYARWINCWAARALVIPRIKDEFFMRFGLYFIGGLLVTAQKLEISDLLVFAVYYETMSNAMKSVSSADAQLQADMPMTDRFMCLLNAKEEIKENQSEKLDCPDTFKGIEIEDVSFIYKDTIKEILKDFNLTIAPGERIALVGRSGSGKTTILKLITGMLTPTRGRVYYSGVDITKINHEQMYQKIGVVMQENILFHTSLRENLRYGKSDATEEEMIAACKKACIWDFISKLPGGLDTIIGEKGVKLSGGQRQRVVLARLFLQDVDIYVFDEATSALDQYNENLIQDAIQSLGNDKTLIVVAHRESSIRLCDRVVKIGE